MKKVHFGTTSREFTRTCKQLCEICNILAVYYLKKEDINSALDLLKKSEELCENNELGQAMTFNNMACYYRRIGKMRTALNFLQRALTIESRLQRPEIQADTHLNICAVLSQLNKHELALNHAMSAVILLQEMMLAKRLDPSAFAEDEEDLPPETSKDRTAVLAIAYHNMGVEQEFLRSYPAAILSYKKAVNFAEKNLGPEDGITQNLRNVFENAKVEVSRYIASYKTHSDHSYSIIAGYCPIQARWQEGQREGKEESWRRQSSSDGDDGLVRHDDPNAQHGASRRGGRRRWSHGPDGRRIIKPGRRRCRSGARGRRRRGNLATVID